MSILTDAEIIALWVVSGGSINTAARALAAAKAESSGSTTVTSPNPDGGTNVGLYQLDTRGKGAGYTVAQLQNPYLNSQLAVKGSSNGKDWSAWPDQWADFIAQAQNEVQQFSANAGKNLKTYAQHVLSGVTTGSAAPSSSGSGSTAGAGGNSTQSAVLTGFNPVDIIDPFKLFQDIAGDLAGGVTGGVGIAQSLEKLTKDFTDVISLIDHFSHGIEWLFKPSHWVRIFAGLMGLGTLAVGTYALMKTGSGGTGSGDISLALGILLVTAAGVLLFIAFHNLDPSITDLSELIGALSDAVTGKDNKLNVPANS